MTLQVCDSCEIGGVTYFFAAPMSEIPTVSGTPKVIETGLNLSISSCWRGYVGKWRVESGGLYLDAIDGKYALADGKPVLADWISGKLELTSIPNPGWSSSEANTNYEILVTKGVVWGFRQLPDDPKPTFEAQAPLTPVHSGIAGSPQVAKPKHGRFVRSLDMAISKVFNRVVNRSWEDRRND